VKPNRAEISESGNFSSDINPSSSVCVSAIARAARGALVRIAARGGEVCERRAAAAKKRYGMRQRQSVKAARCAARVA